MAHDLMAKLKSSSSEIDDAIAAQISQIQGTLPRNDQCQPKYTLF